MISLCVCIEVFAVLTCTGICVCVCFKNAQITNESLNLGGVVEIIKDFYLYFIYSLAVMVYIIFSFAQIPLTCNY